jgi:fumarate reductase flavoprotein subunit
MSENVVSSKMSRRSFVTAAAATAALSVSAASIARAAESASADAAESASADTAAAESASQDAPEDVRTPGLLSRVEAGEHPDWLGEAPEIAESDITDTWDYDVVVVGAGTSGLFATASAAEAGAKTLCIEKQAAAPGIRGTIGAVNSKYQAADGVEIDIPSLCHDMEHHMASNCNPRLLKLWAENSAEMIEWYGDLCEKAGRQFTYDADSDLAEGETVYKHWPVGHVAINEEGRTAEDSTVLLDYCDQEGAEIKYWTTMVKLEQDESGRVTGLIATDENDNYVRINASKGVIICTGGYGRNDDMLVALQPETIMMYSYNSAIPGTTGDGIKACLWAGASMDTTHTSMLFDRCPLRPDEIAGYEYNSNMFWMGSQPWLKVNLNGERFCNESEPYDLTLHASLHQPGHTYCTLWDANYEDYIYQFKTQGCSRMFPFDNGAPVSAIPIEVAKQMNEGLLAAGYIQQADTIEELAEKLNIPADNLVATVEHYNELVAAGEDTDFGKEPFRLSPLDTAPFYGVRQTGYMLCTMDGITIDENINALDKDGNPIEGLYVAGNDSGSYFANTYPDLVPGAAAGRSATFGRLAAKNAAAR